MEDGTLAEHSDLNHISTNLLEVMLLQWSKKGEVYQPAKWIMIMLTKLQTATHQECCSPWLPFVLEFMKLPDTLPGHFPLSWQLSILRSKWGFLANGSPLESGTGSNWTLNKAPDSCLALPPLIEVGRLGQSNGDCYWVYTIDQLMQP